MRQSLYPRMCSAGTITFSLVLVFGAALTGHADHTDVDYVRDIKPILKARCYACHGALKQEAELRLDTGSLILRGGTSGPPIAVKAEEKSLLLARVSATDASQRMPPDGEPLAAAQIDLLRVWVAQGATSPSDELPEEDTRRHWAFQVPTRPAIPLNSSSLESNTSGFNPIDAFLMDNRQAVGVQPMPQADRATLLRRLYIDLIGLPPTADELQRFISDASEAAYETVVDALLESPQHGERWARHWMDVWRYSDWYGRRAVPDVMNSYPMVWRWRDWIVRSVNQDKPYDQMIVEMLAADELMPDDDQNLVATGYLVRSWFKWNYETWKKDLVEHTGKAFLGLTLNCAQCHDHKYDPLTQEEYFRFRAFFEPLELRHDRVPGEADPGPFVKYVYALSYGPIKSGMVRVFDEYLNAETHMFSKGDARLRMEGKPAVRPGAPAVLGGDKLQASQIGLPITVAYPGMKELVRDEERSKWKSAIVTAEKQLADARSAVASEPAKQREELQAAVEARLSAAKLELESLEKRIKADSVRYSKGAIAEDRKNEPEVKAMIQSACTEERKATLATAKSNVASAESAIAIAEVKLAEANTGEDKATIDKATKALQAAQKQRAAATDSLNSANAALSKELGEYTPLSQKYPQVTTGRRAVLARWIANKDNPLTARVAVNHVWLRHFGQALVDSPNDFGRNGSQPTHPKLLDWLACELMDSGWSLKHLHRLIVTSQSYRMASMIPHSLQHIEHESANAAAIDPDNKTYWRFPASRMQAEVVRDSLLALSGELDQTLGGHEIDHKQGMISRRRSLYFAHHGEEKMEFLELFDAANPCDCYSRTSSVQPQQALALINSELTKSLSRQLEKRLWTWANSNTSESKEADVQSRFVRIAFLQVLNREPREQEVLSSLKFLTEQAGRLTVLDGTIPGLVTSERARENLLHALMNHNDFVTIR
ncbi:MAG TPA: DUF1553 domain-containing protein [Pirellula sp.]|nr:DUF1553 domain-containing protein [Pirellula sp.]